MSRVRVPSFALGSQRNLTAYFLWFNEGLPLTLFKSNKHTIIRYKDRSLYQHSITPQKGERFVIAHRSKPIFELKLPIELTAGVKEAPNGKTALLIELGELFFRGVLNLYVAIGIRKFMIL